jgi:hypothetical protein
MAIEAEGHAELTKRHGLPRGKICRAKLDNDKKHAAETQE